MKPRAGVIDLIKYCKKNKIKIGFASSTTKNNIDAVFISLNKYLKKSDFNYIGHNKIIKNFNNKTDIYLHCLKKLKLSNKDCLAIEDTEISLKYAKKAKLRCVAFPGDYHRSGKYKDSFIRVKRLNSKIFADL